MKKQWYAVRTQFHGGGIISRHKNEELAAKAAKKYRMTDCCCGCAGVAEAAEYDRLESAGEQSWPNPYALTQ
jgi:hypothetical protein